MNHFDAIDEMKESEGQPLLDEQGRILRWYATGTDIEERKQAEERIRKENLALREEIDHSSMFEEIVGSSEALRRVLAQVAKVAPVDSTVLISGETGTGKEKSSKPRWRSAMAESPAHSAPLPGWEFRVRLWIQKSQPCE